MPFTGKATYTAGPSLPELSEDVADIISIVSPFETALLEHLGDARRPAASTVHEWIEDALLPNTDTIDQAIFDPDALTATEITVANAGRFRVGDQVRPDRAREVLFVTAIDGDTLIVVRQYGGTPGSNLADGQTLHILGNAALEGDDSPAARFTARSRRRNFTQIFTAAARVSGTMRATRLHGAEDELDFQKQQRLRELLRDLENCVINGVAAADDPQGSSTVRRTMNGIIPAIETNIFVPGEGDIPPGGGDGEDGLTEEVLNAALRLIWSRSNGPVDTIVVGGHQKRRINSFITSNRAYSASDTRFRDLVSVYESDFGVCRVVLSRWVPPDSVLLLDSSRVEVLPLAGRSFHYKPLGAAGDSDAGQLIGEYTLEFRNENAHGLIRALATA